MKNRVLRAAFAALIIAFSGTNVIALAEQYPLSINVTASADVAVIRISGVIHEYQNSAAEFKKQIDAALEKGVTNVELHINTPGGSVFEANEIANEIRRFKGTIKGYGGALVASAGSYLALICDSFEMAANGQYMYHKPMGMLFGNEDKIKADLQLLTNLTKQYRTAYSEKTGLSEDEIESRWSKGDVWLSAEEAKEQGFITAVTSKQEKVTEDHRAMFVACGAPKIPIENNKNTDMDLNVIKAALGLPSDATEAQIEAAAKAAKQAQDTAVANKDAEKDAATIKATALVDAGITAKKIDASQREAWIANATANYEGTKAIVDATAAPAKPDFKEQPNATGAADTARANWTLADYLEKDPQALNDLEAKDPTKFIALNEAYYGIKL